MTKEDDLLARELGKVAASKKGEIGKILGDAKVADAAAMGESYGASLMSRFLPTERFQRQIVIHADARTVLTKVHGYLLSNGRVSSSDELEESPNPTISGVLGSGFLNKNPALVHCEVSAISDQGCTVVITGAAKEGLIKQHTAEKAVKRLIESLQSLGE